MVIILFILFDFNFAFPIFGHACVWWSSLLFVRLIEVFFPLVTGGLYILIIHNYNEVVHFEVIVL